MPEDKREKPVVFKLPLRKYWKVFGASFLILTMGPLVFFGSFVSTWQFAAIWTCVALFFSLYGPYVFYRAREVFIEADAEKIVVKSPEKIVRSVVVPYEKIQKSIIDGTGGLVLDYGEGLFRLPDGYRSRDGTDLVEYLKRQIGRRDPSKAALLVNRHRGPRPDHEVYRLAPSHYIYMNVVLIGGTVLVLALSFGLGQLRKKAPSIPEVAQHNQPHGGLDPMQYVGMGVMVFLWILVLGNILIWHQTGQYHVTVEEDGFIEHQPGAPGFPKRYRYSEITRIYRSWDGMYKLVLKNGRTERINPFLRNSQERFTAFVERMKSKLN